MKIEDFFARLEEEYAEVEHGSLTTESVFREVINWSSINAVILMALVKTEFDVTLSAEDIATSKTVGDLFDIIKLRVQSSIDQS